MSIKEQIQAIVSKRQESKQEFLDMHAGVEAMCEFISDIKKFQNRRCWQEITAAGENLRDEWQSLTGDVALLEQLADKLSGSEGGSLEECLKRVQRDYINVGCVGPWRQGKSTVIAMLTGLSDYVIPRSKFLNCTGTTINVFNGGQVTWNGGRYTEGSGNKAVVYYHSFPSICREINKYTKKLGLQPMSEASSREQFLSNADRCLRANASKAVKDSRLKEMLDNYLKNAKQYVDELRTKDGMFDEITSLDTEESQRRLRPLVSYYEKPDEKYEDMKEAPRVFKVLAVRKVDVYTDFKVLGLDGPEEAGRIQFVDTPGLGESKLEVADILSRALREELDIAICLRKVSAQHGITPDDSYRFHKELKQNTAGRKPENWVFYLYNKEGDVPENMLSNTRASVDDDLFNTIEEGLEGRPAVGGIKLSESHIACIDAAHEKESLQAFFGSILEEMGRTIANSDEAFYKEARSLYQEARDLYERLLAERLPRVSRCLPTFDTREQIIETLKAVKDKRNRKAKRIEKLNETIAEALSQFYDETCGVTLAGVLGVPEKDIKSMKENIDKALGVKERPFKDRISNRKEITRGVLLPYVENTITQHTVDTSSVGFYSDELRKKLFEAMVSKALALIEASEAIKQMEEMKRTLWRTMMEEGKLSMGKTDTEDWLEHFLRLLEEGGRDFKDLETETRKFKEWHIDLKEEIESVVKTKISDVSKKNQILQGDGQSISKIQEMVYKNLIESELQTKVVLREQYGNSVEGMLSHSIQQINDKVIAFEKILLPTGSMLTYEVVFEQLVKFYNKYFNDIFPTDEQAERRTAVSEWEVLRQKSAKNK